jgi:hypothetical protein
MEVSKSGVARTLGVCILGVLLAVVAVSLSQARGSAGAQSSVVGPGKSIQ